jgi:hypothetical protein
MFTLFLVPFAGLLLCALDFLPCLWCLRCARVDVPFVDVDSCTAVTTPVDLSGTADTGAPVCLAVGDTFVGWTLEK